MILALTLLVRDEADIVEDMLNYHYRQGVDIIIATDNGSTDGTLDILKRYQKTKKLELILEPPSDFSQHRWVSRMANIAYEKYGASWIINADADEFFVPQHANLKAYFRSIANETSVLQVARHDFVPFERPKLASPQLEMVYRKTVSCNIKGNPLPPKVVHRGSPNITVSQGNHAVTGKHLSKPVMTDALFVYHYPIRSYEQFYYKVKNAGSGYAINKELASGQGFHKRTWYNHLLNGQLKEVYEQEMFFSAKKLKAAMMNKEIIEDRTVADFFTGISS